MRSIARLATTLQRLFTTTADHLGQESGFVQRRRRLTGSAFAQTLVFGHLAAPLATLGQLQQLAATSGVTVSRQAIAQRCTARAASFLRALLEQAATAVFYGDPVAIPLLQRFPAVLVLDSTVISLPAALAETWPGCGGSSPKAGAASLKVQVRLDLVRGGLDALELLPGRRHDQRSRAQTAPVPPGALRLHDLGYFALPVLAALVADGGHFLCQPQGNTVVQTVSGQRQTVAAALTQRRHGRCDQLVLLGSQAQLPCRLLAQRLPDEVAAQRLARAQQAAQHSGTALTAAQRLWAHWIVLVTSLSARELSLAEALVFARLRWQVELLFKLWKTGGGQLATLWSADPWRALCGVYAKLLALLVQHWLLVTCCWVYADKSLRQAAQTIRSRAPALVSSLHRSQPRLREEIRLLRAVLATGCQIGRKRRHPAAYQLALATTAKP